LIRWGAAGEQGEYLSSDGDVISVPSWIFRGFTNVGPDDGILLTVLGHDVTGGIIWGPSVLKEAESYGLHLTADNRLIDTVAGDQLPQDVELIKPMKQIDIDELTPYTPAQMRERVTQNADRIWVPRPFLCSALSGGGAELAMVIGYGMSEDRRATPRLHEPHHFNLSWLRARVGDGMLTHRHDQTQVLVGKAGRWRVTLNRGDDQRTVELGPQDTLSVPPGSWRSFELVETGLGRPADSDMGELLIVNGSDGRVLLEWDEAVVERARKAGWVIDPNGYLAPASVMGTATDDD
jgi:mannose-6-phosphate isomerase-like protein (cupin superfamily)